MSINLLETVQQNLGYSALQKIDPNTQQVVVDDATPPEDKFSQAAIPATLAGLFAYAQSDEGATEILQGTSTANWAGKIFEENKKEAIQTISDYAGQSIESSVTKMNAIANETIKVVKENLKADAAIKDVKQFFSDQKNNILLYLPAALHMGELLHDNTLDDNTNKMEGPISSLMHSIGAAFTNPVIEEEVKKPEVL